MLLVPAAVMRVCHQTAPLSLSRLHHEVTVHVRLMRRRAAAAAAPLPGNGRPSAIVHGGPIDAAHAASAAGSQGRLARCRDGVTGACLQGVSSIQLRRQAWNSAEEEAFAATASQDGFYRQASDHVPRTSVSPRPLMNANWCS